MLVNESRYGRLVRAWRTLPLAAFAAYAIFSAGPVKGQEPPADQLKIVVNAGEGDKHKAEEKKTTYIEVQVLNEVDLPQPGAEVTFQSPAPDEPSVLFEGGKNMVKVISDAQGIARIEEVRGNNLEGTVQVDVTASFEGKTGTKSITQTNLGKFFTRRKKLITTGIVSTAAVTLVLVFKPGPDTLVFGTSKTTAAKP